MRGALECARFPKTGYPPTDVAAWQRIFATCKAYGLNHLHFHSWCPPEAAFTAADQAGLYSANRVFIVGQPGRYRGQRPPARRLYAESRRLVRAYGNHPSFCMLTYGNEPAGKQHVAYLTKFLNYWKTTDARRLYTVASGWPIVADNNYNVTPDPRIQAWGQDLKSIINAQAPRTDYDWRTTIAQWQHPTGGHEIGQWCAYSDFKEIAKYDGVLQAKNFGIFRDRLAASHLSALADSFLLASGKLQVLCYKADVEAALRTPGFGGFQLLGLHDFPGQGTALVGVLSPFWEDKGYVTAPEYRRFCGATGPLARFPKMGYLNSETLTVPVEIAHFGPAPLPHATPTWVIEDAQGQPLFRGTLLARDIALGNGQALGEVRQALGAVTQLHQLRLRVAVGAFENSWDFFGSPAPCQRPASRFWSRSGSVSKPWTSSKAAVAYCSRPRKAPSGPRRAVALRWAFSAFSGTPPGRAGRRPPRSACSATPGWNAAARLPHRLPQQLAVVGDAVQLRSSLEQYMASPRFQPATPVAPERIAELLKEVARLKIRRHACQRRYQPDARPLARLTAQK